MIIDSQELFSSAQAVTAIGDTVSTNQLDTISATDDGLGEDVDFIIKCDTAPTSGGAATIQGVLQHSADNSTWVDALAGPVMLYSTVVAGTELLKARLPYGLRRYVRVVYRVATAVLTAGNFSAFVALDSQAYQYGASGFSVN